jgi:hypothetical protein
MFSENLGHIGSAITKKRHIYTEQLNNLKIKITTLVYLMAAFGVWVLWILAFPPYF